MVSLGSVGSIPVRIRELWVAQSPVNRLVIGAVLVAIVVAVGIFGGARFRPATYGVLFANLPPDEASAVINKLDASKIPHRISADGSAVLIPQEYIPEQRVALAGQASSGWRYGLRVFDRTSLHPTDTQEKIAESARPKASSSARSRA